MGPIKPHWVQPSHPDVQEVIVNDAEFTTKSISKVTLAPFALFAKFEFPPCTEVTEVTYATVQMGRDRHLDLNSDLLYINHSCEPSLIFDTGNRSVIAGPKGLKPGDELTFFYPSTEWHMAQPFDCLCGTPTCRGRIAGARDMTPAQLEGLWLNAHIRELLEEREKGTTTSTKKQTNGASNGTTTNGNGVAKPTTIAPTAENQTITALREALTHAEKVVEAARLALVSYVEALQVAGFGSPSNGKEAASVGAQRRGPTSRELSGEMGGDTTVRV
ncbi:hypothetical protein N0V88_000330 [Collariella sp. IMI 366227]|nr:hypothetical protein N0V88_000330 [Collariella sp. IMI 366227]